MPDSLELRNSVSFDGFYQRGSIASYASACIVRADMSVYLSVCHTLVLYQNEQVSNERHDFFTDGEPNDSSVCILKFKRGHPERGRLMRLGWVPTGDFRPLSHRISETVQDRTKVAIITNMEVAYALSIGTKIMTLN